MNNFNESISMKTNNTNSEQNHQRSKSEIQRLNRRRTRLKFKHKNKKYKQRYSSLKTSTLQARNRSSNYHMMSELSCILAWIDEIGTPKMPIYAAKVKEIGTRTSSSGELSLNRNLGGEYLN